jgi:hypothetical protein
LEKQPFQPLRLHLVSGKPIIIRNPNAAWLMQNTVMILRHHKAGKLVGDGYDVVALRNIERIEQITPRGRSRNGVR